MRLQQAALSRGEAQYRDRQNEVCVCVPKQRAPLPSLSGSHCSLRAAKAPCLDAVMDAVSRGKVAVLCTQVRVATIRITDLQRELNVAAAAASHVGALQDHCHRLSRQLLQVRDAHHCLGCPGIESRLMGGKHRCTQGYEERVSELTQKEPWRAHGTIRSDANSQSVC